LFTSFISRAKTLKVSEAVSPSGTTRRRLPSVASNAQGDVLLAWAEGTGWQRGGAVAWQLFDADNQPGEKGRLAESVPVWGLVSAVARADGSFVIFH
jgi:hypothetical protein